MGWHETIFELIDMRSFSNLWYWIALAVIWSAASQWVLGVPFDMITRARKTGGAVEADLEALVRININRLMYIARVSGLWLMGLASFMLSGLVILGWAYGVEFAQALFLLGCPMALVAYLNIATARAIQQAELHGAALRQRLMRHRAATQAIGMASVFITALWGMYQNLSIGALGG